MTNHPGELRALRDAAFAARSSGDYRRPRSAR
jgi:hypothetical protein